MSKTNRVLHKRFVPLYVAAFSHGFVFWYAIEKLFMRNIGFDDAGIGVMIAFYSAIMLMAETPFGILADRWSRRGVLMLASVALALSALIGGVSTEPFHYLMAAGLWGIFFALYSGTYDSIVYDTVLEEGESSEKYEYFFGRVRAIDGAALAIGSIIGGLVAEYVAIRAAYFLTIPAVLISLAALARFKEPQLHKSHVAVPIAKHIRNTFRAVLRSERLLPVMIVLVLQAALIYTVFEFSQLWLIALAAPIVLFGPANALHLSSLGVGGLAAGQLKLNRPRRMAAVLVLAGLCSAGMVFSRHVAIAVACIALLSICLVVINVIFTRLLHDQITSTVRAGAASAVSTLGRVIMIPLVLVFGVISTRADVFSAAWLIFGLVAVMVVFVLKAYAVNKNVPVVTPRDELAPEPYNK